MLLPRLLADAPITRRDLARLAEGGVCLHPSWAELAALVPDAGLAGGEAGDARRGLGGHGHVAAAAEGGGGGGAELARYYSSGTMARGACRDRIG